MTEISAAMVKELRDATSAGMMDCKRALAGDRRRLRRGRQAAAREGHGVGGEARRPRDERRQGRRDGSRQTSARSPRSAARPSRCRTTTTSSATRRACSRPSSPTATRHAAALEEQRVELTSKLGENIQVDRCEADDRQATASCCRSTCTVRPTRSARSCARGAASPKRRPQPGAAPDVRAADLLDARRGATGARRRRARDPLELRGGAVEAGERPREDRRGPAQQAVLRRGRARASRPGTAPTSSPGVSASTSQERGIELVDYAWYSVG